MCVERERGGRGIQGRERERERGGKGVCRERERRKRYTGERERERERERKRGEVFRGELNGIASWKCVSSPYEKGEKLLENPGLEKRMGNF